MLDAFLEVVSGHTKVAQVRARTAALMEKLPTSELMKVASGVMVPKEAYESSGPCWLDQFKGTPLFDQAIALEKEDLDIQMEEAERRRQEVALRANLPTWEETDARRSNVAIQRKLLELEAAGGGGPDPAEMGGQEGEDAAPPDLEAAEPAAAPPMPKVEGAPAVPVEQAVEGEGGEEENPFAAAGAPAEKERDVPPAAASEEEKPKEEGDKPKSDKPKTKVTTVEKETEPKEKIDIKAASARMRFALVVKEASFLDGKVEGVGRVGQLITGSRKKLLEEASGHATNMFGQNGKILSDTLKGDAVREGRKVLATRVGAGALAAGGVAAGAKALSNRSKEASVDKEAFGGAILGGLKGMGRFAGAATKSIGAAGKSGGVGAAGQAAANAGRAGMMRAGNFIAQNPGAAATMAAVPLAGAAGAGYAASR